MLSYEEKKAIETIKDFKNLKWYEHAFDNGTEVLDEEEKQDIDILLNLIEKQSKEIEILNENMNLLREQNISYKQSIHGLKEMNKIINKKWKDKIKAKIEEIKKYKDLARDSIEERIVIADSDSLNYGRKEAHEKDIEVLQSLLEKE